MIYGNINYLADESHYPKKIYEVLKMMRGYNFAEMEDQKITVEGEDIFFILTHSDTEPVEDRKPETHKKYLDIQLLLEGKEKIGCAVLNENAVSENGYDAEAEVEFYSSIENETLVALEPGDFLVLFPEDIHKPLCAFDKPMTIRKVIAKVNVDIL